MAESDFVVVTVDGRRATVRAASILDAIAAVGLEDRQTELAYVAVAGLEIRPGALGGPMLVTLAPVDRDELAETAQAIAAALDLVSLRPCALCGHYVPHAQDDGEGSSCLACGVCQIVAAELDGATEPIDCPDCLAARAIAPVELADILASPELELRALSGDR